MFASLLSLLTLSVGACDPEASDLDTRDEAADVTVDAGPVVDTVAAAAPRLLREVKLSDTHVVNFWVLDSGAGLVQESFHADLDDGPVLPKDGVQRTFAELHRAVLPGEEVPAELLEVDELAAVMAAEQPVTQDDEAGPPARPDGFSAAEPEATAACGAWDWAGDKAWFFANFCVGGNHQDCVANWTAVNSWRHAVSWFSTRVFNQSMEAPAQVKVGHQNCWWDFWGFDEDCEWIQDFNYSLANRKVDEWHSTGSGRYYVDIAGSGPCARVGMAQLWNTKSEGGGGTNPQPNPNPAGACNWIGEACCPQVNVAGFYCDATHDYQLKCNSGYCGH